MDFAENLKFLRKYRNLTQTKLAHKANISVNTVINYENGRRKQPTLSAMFKLAEALDVPPEALTANNLFVENDTLFAEKYDSGAVIAIGTDGPPSDEALENYLSTTKVYNSHFTVEYAQSRMKFFLECLNETGLHEAVKRVQELTEISRYTNLRRADECQENGLQTDPEHNRASDLTGDGRLNTAPGETPEQES